MLEFKYLYGSIFPYFLYNLDYKENKEKYYHINI